MCKNVGEQASTFGVSTGLLIFKEIYKKEKLGQLVNTLFLKDISVYYS